mgnify:CR=1 FL=1
MNNLSFNPYGLREGELSSGTTIMAVTFDGGVVLGNSSKEYEAECLLRHMSPQSTVLTLFLSLPIALNPKVLTPVLPQVPMWPTA